MRNRSRVGSRIALCVALAWATLSVGAAEPGPLPLFEAAWDHPSHAAAPAGVLRHRLVEPRLESIRDADVLRLNLFDDVDFIATRDRTEVRSPRDFTWFGRLGGIDRSLVVLTVRQGSLAGHVRHPHALYRIGRVEGAAHEVQQIDPGSFPSEAPPIEVPARASISPDSGSIATDTGDVIDLMVVYTPAAAAAVPDIETEIQLAVDVTNQTYVNSGIVQRVRLVLTRPVDYVESGNSSTDLNRLQNPTDGFMDEVHPWRDEYCADTVQLWNEGMEACGRAFVLIDEGATFEAYAFSVVWKNCPTNVYTTAHELGHNMGARHERLTQPEPGAFEYSHGYTDTVAEWKTVMAIIFGDRVPYWSNPDVLYGGVPMGIPEGQPDSADNRRTLNNTASLVANFRPSDACALEVPAPTLGIDKGSAGDVTVSWGVDCGTAWDYTVYGGDLDSLIAGGTFTHESVVCSDVGGDLTETFTPAPGNRYFLVVPRNQTGLEGIYGSARPPGADTSGCGIVDHRPGACP